MISLLYKSTKYVRYITSHFRPFEYFTTPTPHSKLIHRDATTHAFILLKAVLISEIYKEIQIIDLESVEWIF